MQKKACSCFKAVLRHVPHLTARLMPWSFSLSPSRSLQRSRTIKRRPSSGRHSIISSCNSTSETDTPSSNVSPILDAAEEFYSPLSSAQMIELDQAEESQRQRSISSASSGPPSGSIDISPYTDDEDAFLHADLEDPSRAFYRNFALYGKSKETWHLENPYLYGKRPDINQLQLYVLGISHGHFAETSCIFQASGQGPYYKCRYPNCNETWRNEREHKRHQIEHPRLFMCQRPDCHYRNGFRTNIDLLRHLQNEHGHGRRYNSMRGYACASEACPSKDKVWLRQDSFRLHCQARHPFDDSEELVERSVISL